MFGVSIAVGIVWVFLSGVGLGFGLHALGADFIKWDAARRLAGLRPARPRPAPAPAPAAAPAAARPRKWPARPTGPDVFTLTGSGADDLERIRRHYEEPYAASTAARPLAGHPVLEGAGYDCCCGACLAQLGYVPRVRPAPGRVGESAPWSPAAPPPPAAYDPYDPDRAAAGRRRARGRLRAADESGEMPAIVAGMEPTMLRPLS